MRHRRRVATPILWKSSGSCKPQRSHLGDCWPNDLPL